jgi:transcriptional regulator with XRE-family HTH domain
MPRPLKAKRPAPGAHLLALRKAAGLSQVELANLIGETQGNVAYWETCNHSPRSDVLPRLAQALGVSVEDILSVGGQPKRRKAGPVSRADKLMQDLAKLPRRQQDKVYEVIYALLNKYSAGESN